MPKGTCYGGVCRFPNHPAADMHGLVRFAYRTDRGPLAVLSTVEKYGITIPPYHYWVWGESKSHIEELASAAHYGELLVCSLTTAYLRAENYHPVPKLYLLHTFVLKKGTQKVCAICGGWDTDHQHDTRRPGWWV